ncbi:gas vesicle protein GvpM [Salinigranum rubrum]|uniref:Gas vesicle protein GvpM n=1 Tax=Salinigranum rubrum TaxID=755307 RepID=A0A2I8VKJ0_9EURY|nr:gas vesicle protein [Salinigranum rubrum]AUV82447.1 gas vesicle protein GvpM [Salinigranum rubrum]
MRPTRESEDAVVDLADVLLRDGVVVEADVLVSVADVPLVGLELRAAVAGMAAMRDAGMLTAWDEEVRLQAQPSSEFESESGVERGDDADR